MRCTLLLVGVASIVLVGPLVASAQTTGATLQGTISDPQGALLPGVAVVIRNTETGLTREQTTDARGWYRVPALPPGTYEIRSELSGFGTQVRTGLVLTIGQEATVNLTLQLASVQETVTVTGEAPLIETSKSALGTTVTRHELDSLPLIGRNFAGLANLTPGISGVGGGGVNASGQTTRSNSYLVDGASNDDTIVATQRGGFSLEAVREFVVMSNQFTAEYGMASGAIVSVVTRSGTNDAQGRFFLFHRDDALDAQNPFSRAQGSGKAPFSQQRFGGFFGGPIVRDRLHYFGSYEGNRQRETAVVTSPLVPITEREFATPTDGHQAFVKTDHRITGKQTLTVRYRADKNLSIGNGIGGLSTKERGNNTDRLDQDVVANHTTVLNSRTVNELRFQFARRSTFSDTMGWSVDGMPEINRPSGRLGKAQNMPQGRDENRYQFVNNLSYSRGAHDMKVGLDVSLIRGYSFFPRNRDGNFTFSTDAPFNPSDLTTYPTQYVVARIDPNQHLPNDLYSFFVQDSWRVRSNVTINAGARYDRETGFGKITNTPDDKNNLQPRVGLVWDPFSDGRTAVRGGYGHYIDQSFLNIQLNVASGRRSVEIVILNPGYPDPFSRGSISNTPPSTVEVTPRPTIPETRTASLGIKREIAAGIAVAVDGVYSRGFNQYHWTDLNYPDPVTGRRPDPAFGRRIEYNSEGNSWYSGLLTSIEGRRGRGPSWGVSYTVSRTLRNVEGFQFTAQDQRHPELDKGLADTHRKHQLVGHVTWSLPGGVQVAGLLSARSGRPWNVTTGRDNNNDTFTNDRPDLVNPTGHPRDRNTYSGNFTGRVGNLGRNANIGDAFSTLDVRLSKFVKLPRARVEAFIEGFNATNRVNFGLPNGNIRSSTFGQSTAIEGSPRQVEIGFRIDF
ncbi:MAG: TonB-dependent receptor [Acidobacteria bacterium]|nr:TonB-dependent receptor [Acidobacteriota bacterium]